MTATAIMVDGGNGGGTPPLSQLLYRQAAAAAAAAAVAVNTSGPGGDFLARLGRPQARLPFPLPLPHAGMMQCFNLNQLIKKKSCLFIVQILIYCR
jgi:hypothetical protein